MDEAYVTIGVTKGCSVEELKSAYKKKAAAVHPMNGGSLDKFSHVSQCFREIYADIVGLGADNHPVEVDRHGFTTPDGKIDKDKFNQMFEASKIPNAFERGYGDQMVESSGTREDFSFDAPQELKTNFDNDAFNALFNKQAKLQQTPKALNKPEPLGGLYDHFENLDDDVTHFSGSGASGLAFTDYMIAHTTSQIIDPDHVDARPEFKNVKEYVKFREDDIKSMPRPTKADIMNDVLRNIDEDIEHYDKVLLRDRKLFHKV